MLETAVFTFNEAAVQAVAEGNEGPVWLEALPARVYQTPFYGEVPVTTDRLENMVKNFKENVRGQDIAVDFNHGLDKAKGDKASGWYRDLEIRPSSDDPNQVSLYAAVEFTEEAKKEIKDNQWKYFSAEWDDWMDNDGNKHQDVIVGGALTNRPIAKKTMPINFSETMYKELDTETKAALLDALAESKEMEHSEPGTGSPPPPRKDEDGSDDPAIKGGWRRDPLPVEAPENKNNNNNEGGELQVKDAELIAKIREVFGIKVADDADEAAIVKANEDLVEKATTQFSEYTKLKEAVTTSSEEKDFEKKYPTQFAEHRKLLEKSRENDAIQFSESVKGFTRTEGDKQVATDKGLSGLALEEVKKVHKKFAEGSATLEDFTGVVNTIVHGGIVDYSENGSSSTKEVKDFKPGSLDARKAFAELASEVMDEKEKDWSGDYEKSLAEAAKRNPGLADAYAVALPAL